MKTNKPQFRWIIDAFLLVPFIGAYFLDLTGLALHQLIGAFSALIAGYHLALHLDWVTAVLRRFFTKTSGRARLYFSLDLGIISGGLTILITGLVISSWLNLALTNYDVWLQVHILASIATLGMVGAKIAAHWRWIVLTGRKLFTRPIPQPQMQPAAIPPSGQRQMSRREFLRVAVPAGAVTLAAGAMAVRALSQLNFEEEATNTQYAYAQSLRATPSTTPAPSKAISTTAATPPATTQTIVNTPTQLAPTQVVSQNVCSVLCSRRCSYPGRCGRYVDTNNNNRCDRGECA